MRRLRVHANRAVLPPGVPHTTMLYPWWGAPASDERSPTRGRFERWIATGPELMELTEPEQADVVVVPAAWEHLEGRDDGLAAARACADEARRLGTPLLVFYVSDSEAPVPVEGAIVYRTSLRRSALREGERAMPALSMDVGRELGGVTPRTWSEPPRVGFCGYAMGAERTPGARGLARRLKRRLVAPAGIFARSKALAALGRSQLVELDAIVRDAFWAGAVEPGQPVDYELMAAARRDFLENLRDCDYALCARGGGNFSYRLYEALSAGRVPLFVDTDCVLPFEDEIDWRALCVWVDEKDIASAPDAVATFHARGPEAFADAQRACRRVWERYLSPEGFFAQLARRHVGASA